MVKGDASPLHCIDEINRRLEAVGAILDCATVLSALQSMPEVKSTEFATGAGFANGYVLADDAIPLIVNHARDLIREVKMDANRLHDLSKKPVTR